MKRYLASFSTHFFPLKPLNLLLFALLWLFIGFAVGTSVLMGPVRWVTDIVAYYALSADAESWLVRVTIVLYVLATLVLALYLTRAFVVTRSRLAKAMIVGLPLLCTVGALWLFLNPRLMGVHQGTEEAISTRFVLGPYPTEDKLRDLRARGFTAVVSLLHPAVVPFEPKLLADEREHAREIGIELIHLPMLPWVGENESSLRQLRELAKDGDGRYYVHCYLGKDRVRLAANLIRSVDPNAVPADLPVGRDLDVVRRLERGPVIRLAQEVYVGPYPTDEEFLNYVVNGSVDQVVSLMDPASEADREWIEKETALMHQYGIPFRVRPLPLDSVDAEGVRAVVNEIKRLPRPVYIHSFLSPSRTTESLVAVFRGVAPPLNYSALEQPVANGRPYFISDRILFGPRPAPTEVGRLPRYGVHNVGFVGELTAAEGDQALWDQMAELDINFEIIAPEEFDPVEKTGDGQAWYFYGPAIDNRHLALADRFLGQPIYRARRGVYFTAPPELNPVTPRTRDLIMEGHFAAAFSLLDPSEQDEGRLIREAKLSFAERNIPFDNLALRRSPLDPGRALEIAARINQQQKPVVIFAQSMDDPRIDAVYTALQTGEPPLVPRVVERNLTRGPVKVVGPNIAIGPRPTAPEFIDPLHHAGIRSFILVGDANSPQALVDGAIAQKAGMDWQVVDPEERDFYPLIKSGGPWYVYGRHPAVEQLDHPTIGPPKPDITLSYAPVRTGRAGAEKAGPIEQRFETFIRQAIPSVRFVILATPILLIYIYLAAAYAARLKTGRNVRTPYTRKVFHIIIFTGACALQLAYGLSAVVVFGILTVMAVLYATWRGDGFGFYEALARPSDAPRRTLFIIIPLVTTALGGVLANLAFGNFAVVGYLVGGWGDAIGEPVGARWGRHRYRVPSLGGVPATRSLEGSFAVLIVSFGAAVLALYGLGFDWPVILRTAAACAAASTLVEAISNHGLDNLTIQVTAAGVCYALLA